MVLFEKNIVNLILRQECAPLSLRPKVARGKIQTEILLRNEIVCCLLTLMTTPVHPHLVFTLYRPHCSTSKH